MATSLSTVKSSNQKLKDLGPGLVGVFVGGTSGIGEFTLKAFAKHAASPKIYLVGRNESSATRIISEAKALNPDSQTVFIKTPDASLISNVDVACKEIQSREDAINVLFISQGYLTFDGRTETVEGLDRKFSLNYYSRMRFVTNLLPQLTAASALKAGLSRVVSVLGPGHEGKLFEDDLDLKHHFSLGNCASHAIILNDLAAEELAKANPATAFVHTSPGIVKTGVMDNNGVLLKTLSRIAYFALSPFAVGSEECGERNLYMATSGRFPSKAQASEAEDVAIGADGVKGSGAYLLNWDQKPVGGAILAQLRAKGFGKTAWEHTLDMWKQAEAKATKTKSSEA